MIRPQVLFGTLLSALLAVLQVGGASGPVALVTALTAGLAVVLLVCAAGAHLEPAAAPARVRAVALRERARRAAFVPLRDPDAPGRARPRAPAAGSPAA